MSSSKEPWKLSSYSPFNDKSTRAAWFRNKQEKLHTQAKLLSDLDPNVMGNHERMRELFLEVVSLYNSLCRSEDYCKEYAKEKDALCFAEAMRLLETEPCIGLPAVIKADLYRRAGVMEKCNAVMADNGGCITESRLMEHVSELASKGETAAIPPGEILHMYEHSSINKDIDRYFYHDNIL